MQIEILDAWDELAIHGNGLPIPLGGRNVKGTIKIKTLEGSLSKHGLEVELNSGAEDTEVRN